VAGAGRSPAKKDDARRPPASERWPAYALIALVFATGIVMATVALRELNALAQGGNTSPYAILVAVGAPAVIGGAIVGFGFALLRRRGLAPLAPNPAVGESGKIVRLLVFLVPVVVIAPMAAAFFGGTAGSTWSTYVLAALVPLVPAAVVGFGTLLMSAGAEGNRYRGRPPSRITPPTDPPNAGLE
jgi:hypothetical protein